MKEIINKLKNPPKKYRPAPFWSWNDRLRPEVLSWQIKEMDKTGHGGYFMHARGGLGTPYMGEEWMDSIKTCIEEGDKLGMKAWAYDENGWPSGFANGAVNGLGDKYHVRWLELEEYNENSDLNALGILGLYLITDGGCTLISENEITNSNGKAVIIRHKSNQYYIDIMNKEVIKEFIDLTHEKYYSKFGEDFGKGMPGFFTDEPQYRRGEIPWSYIMLEEFEKKYGYNIQNVLPMLFLDLKGHEEVRYQFWALVSELFISSFGEQIYNWCEEHNCQFTGHVMMEDSLVSQMAATAGAMPFYEYMHLPGIDWLGRKIGNPITPKQLGSVAQQLGKKQTLTETFALCGWNVSFEELKWIAEWQFVNGVNFLCQHLEGYTLRGLRKRDYPPSLFYQQPWWEEYKLFNDYFSRLGMLLSDGVSGAEVLLLHPIKSAWIAYDGSKNEKLQWYDTEFERATCTLCGLHIEHHYGDETIINKHGSVKKASFVVGNCSYKVVVLPSVNTIDQRTAELLQSFVDNGGILIGLGELPEMINGIRANELDALLCKVNRVDCSVPEFRVNLRTLIRSGISISDTNGEIENIHIQKRIIDGKDIYYMVNYSQEIKYEAKITIDNSGSAIKYLPESGELQEIEFCNNEDNIEININFLPMQSHVLFVEKNTEAYCAKKIQKAKRIRLPQGQWQIEEMGLNSLTLDYCSYRVDGGEWNSQIPVIKLLDILLQLKRRCQVELKFEFNMNAKLDEIKTIFAAIELPQEFEISINGSKIEYVENGWWKDSEFKKVDIASNVINGKNELILSREFYQSHKVYDVLFGQNVLETEKNKLTYDVELESIYIVGDFGVVSESSYASGERKALMTKGPFVIVDRPTKVQYGELTQQGMCFFADKITLSKDLVIERLSEGRVILEIDKPDAVVSKVAINGMQVGILPWEPYELDINDFIKEGTNKLSITLYPGNRNLLGPHHRVEGEIYRVSPASFTDKNGWAEVGSSDDVWRDRYCFTKFGFK